MLKMVKDDGPNGAPLVMLGLSHGNLDRLRAGEPIRLDIDQCAMLGLEQRELVIFAGESEVAMMREAESHGLVPPGAAADLERRFAEREQHGG